MNGEEETSEEETSGDDLPVGFAVFQRWLEETDDIRDALRGKEAAREEEEDREENETGFGILLWFLQNYCDEISRQKEESGEEESQNESDDASDEAAQAHADSFYWRFWGGHNETIEETRTQESGEASDEVGGRHGPHGSDA